MSGYQQPVSWFRWFVFLALLFITGGIIALVVMSGVLVGKLHKPHKQDICPNPCQEQQPCDLSVDASQSVQSAILESSQLTIAAVVNQSLYGVCNGNGIIITQSMLPMIINKSGCYIINTTLVYDSALFSSRVGIRIQAPIDTPPHNVSVDIHFINGGRLLAGNRTRGIFVRDASARLFSPKVDSIDGQQSYSFFNEAIACVRAVVRIKDAYIANQARSLGAFACNMTVTSSTIISQFDAWTQHEYILAGNEYELFGVGILASDGSHLSLADVDVTVETVNQTFDDASIGHYTNAMSIYADRFDQDRLPSFDMTRVRIVGQTGLGIYGLSSGFMSQVSITRPSYRYGGPPLGAFSIGYPGIGYGGDKPTQQLVASEVTVNCDEGRPGSACLSIMSAINLDFDRLSIVGESDYAPPEDVGILYAGKRGLIHINLQADRADRLPADEGLRARTIAIRNSNVYVKDRSSYGITVGTAVYTYADNATVPFNPNTTISLDNVAISGGSAGVYVGAGASNVVLDRLQVERSYYGIVAVNGSKCTLVRNGAFRDCCIGTLLKAESDFNIVRDSNYQMCTVGIQQNSGSSATANNIIVGGSGNTEDCGPPPILYDVRDVVSPMMGQFHDVLHAIRPFE